MYNICSNERFAQVYSEINTKLEAPLRRYYGGDWSHIPVNSILSDLVNYNIRYLREGLDCMKESIDQYYPEDDIEGSNLSNVVKELQRYLEDYER